MPSPCAGSRLARDAPLPSRSVTLMLAVALADATRSGNDTCADRTVMVGSADPAMAAQAMLIRGVWAAVSTRATFALSSCAIVTPPAWIVTGAGAVQVYTPVA